MSNCQTKSLNCIPHTNMCCYLLYYCFIEPMVAHRW